MTLVIETLGAASYELYGDVFWRTRRWREDGRGEVRGERRREKKGKRYEGRGQEGRGAGNEKGKRGTESE